MLYLFQVRLQSYNNKYNGAQAQNQTRSLASSPPSIREYQRRGVQKECGRQPVRRRSKKCCIWALHSHDLHEPTAAVIAYTVPVQD